MGRIRVAGHKVEDVIEVGLRIKGIKTFEETET